MKTFRQIRINEEVKDSEVDLILEPGKTYILKQKAKDYKRGLLVTLTEDRDYEVAYWINDAKPYPIEMIIDGKSIKQDAKKVKMTRHPELEESITFAKHNSYVGASNTDNPLDEKLVASDISILDTILSKIKDNSFNCLSISELTLLSISLLTLNLFSTILMSFTWIIKYPLGNSITFDISPIFKFSTSFDILSNN